MKRKHFSNIFSFLLAVCMIFAAFPASAFAAENGKDAVFTPQRIFIVSEENPDGTDLAQKVLLVGSEFESKGICDSMQLLYGDASLAEDGDILVQISDTLGSDSFEISPDGKKLLVTAGSPVSAMYGLRNILKSLMLGKEVSAASETPDVAQRIFHLDCGRKYFSKEWMISLIKELSWLQMNQLEVDFSNGTGFRFALDDMSLDINGDGTVDEDLSVLPGGVTDPDSWFTESDMDEIIETAEEYGVEIVPCLDTPGHTGWIFGKDSFSKYSSDGDLDVTDETATAFMKALVKKYAAYFVSKGCTTFHVGGDEYLHGYYNWGTPVASTEGKYSAAAAYLDGLAGELKQLGVKKVRSFNDPLYYNGDTTTHIWQNIDEAEYWCYNGMNSFRYASPGLLAEQGFGMINGHGDFYDILTGGDDNWKKPIGDANTKKTPAGIYAQFQNNTFAGSQEVDDSHVVGSTYFLWCDDPTQGNEQQVAASLYPRLRSSSAKMHDEAASGTYEEFAKTFTDSAGGFTADGSLQDSSPLKPMEIISAEDLRAAEEAIEKITAIGEITDLKTGKTAVETARTAYDSLTPAQKQMVSAAVLKLLEKAENTIARLEEAENNFDLSKASISAINRQDYTGKAVTPSFTVTYNGNVLTEGVDYTAVFSNNINIGTASVTITGKGSWFGTQTTSFAIAVKKGSTWTIGGFRYKITDASAGTAALTGTVKPKASATVKASVQIGGKSFLITEIASKAFQKNNKLKKVTIGKNVSKIGKKAFFNCKKLRTIRVNSKKLTAKSVGSKAFARTSANASVKVPKAKKAAYRKFLYKKGLSKKAKIK